MGAVSSNPLEPEWKDLLSLSARREPEFYEKADDVRNVPYAGVLRTTFDSLGASAVFCVQFVPTVVIVSIEEYDPAHVAPLHAALWNQGLASLLVVISGDTVRVFTLARTPRGGDEDVAKHCLVRALDATADALALGNLIYGAESGRFWEEHPEHFDPKGRVDRVLLDNLTTSHRLLHRAAGLPPDAAQALLVQAMFIAYLEDREIIGPDHFREASNARASDFGGLLTTGDVESLEHLFETLRDDFNGDLFVAPCSFETYDAVPRLRADHLKILARFRSGREEMDGSTGQHRLWRQYDFKYIPVELISAVHDRFLGERESDRRAQGAYYTPMFLADTVVSHVWDRLPPEVRDDARFLDPACGSGIFLVRLFQRLCEHRRAAGPGQTIPWKELLDVAARLQGRDEDGGAVRVAVFSLYVALLDEVTPPGIRKLMKGGRVLPPLHGETLCREDFFAVEPDDAQADVVLGNPPWSSRRGERHSSLEWCEGERLPAPGREQAWPFVWKSLRHLREDGVVAFLLPAMGFLHNHAAPAIKARRRLMREARVLSVVNFADMRFQLFDGAVRPAALLLLGRPPTGSPPYRFDYWTPKADLNLKSRHLITIGGADRCRLDSRTVEDDPSVFKRRLWLNEPEARLFNYLSGFLRLGDLVVEFGQLSRKKESVQDRWVIGQGFKPAKVEHLRNEDYQRRHSGVVASTPYLPIAGFGILARTNRGLQPWKNGLVHRRGFEAGFRGPRVLVPHGVALGDDGRQRLRAAYVEDALTFQHIIQAIVVPPGDERRGKLLAGLLNSTLALWFAFHGTSSFGADRPKVHQTELLCLPFPGPDDIPDPERARSAADAMVSMIDEQARHAGPAFGRQPNERDLLQRIDDLAYDFFCLSEGERILVEDTVEHTISAAQPSPGRSPAIWQSSTASDRRAYARTLADNLADWFDGDCTIGTRLVARNNDLAVLRLSLRDAATGFDYAEDADGSVTATLSRLAEHIRRPLPGNFQSMPDFRVFVDRDLFLVKPTAKRHWLRSTALADVNAIALDLHQAIGRRHYLRPGRI
ncbi:MAG: N-6 DNA methylase [Acidobacteria bacterium]|nr:N-6 DNA methylase [Acidobacteriota bacterium]